MIKKIPLGDVLSVTNTGRPSPWSRWNTTMRNCEIIVYKDERLTFHWIQK